MSQVTITRIVEGESFAHYQFDFLSDGSGELVNEVILSPSDLLPPRPNDRPAFRLMQMWYGFAWFDVHLSFGTLTPEAIWTLPRDLDHVDFRSFGGLLHRSTVPPGDTNGKLCVSTNEFIAGSRGSLVIELRKTNAP